MKSRFWEVDLTRGLAVVMMVLFHLVYDLSYFGVYGLDIYSGFWFYFARTTASIFILLAGVSLSLSASRARLQGQDQKLYLKFVRRGMEIFSLGLGITAVTYLLIGNGFIIFGILHLIGLSIILAYPFLNLKALNMMIGAAIIVVGLYLQGLEFDFPWLLWLGLAPRGFYTLDYFPLFPWFGVILIGIFLGNVLYEGYTRRYTGRMYLPDLSGSALAKPFVFLGQNSLVVYLVHQPVLIAILYLLGKVSISTLLQ